MIRQLIACVVCVCIGGLIGELAYSYGKPAPVTVTKTVVVDGPDPECRKLVDEFIVTINKQTFVINLMTEMIWDYDLDKLDIIRKEMTRPEPIPEMAPPLKISGTTGPSDALSY